MECPEWVEWAEWEEWEACPEWRVWISEDSDKSTRMRNKNKKKEKRKRKRRSTCMERTALTDVCCRYSCYFVILIDMVIDAYLGDSVTILLDLLLNM